jgi:two-component system, NtrC family, sensor kinase
VRRRLAFQLIVSLTLLLALVNAISQFLNVGQQERQLLDGVVRGTDQLSKSIAGATWQAMLADHRATAYQVMQTIASRQGVDHIRIFNKDGWLMFSTDRRESIRLDKRAEVCNPCHNSAEPLVSLTPKSRSRVFRGDDGVRHLAMITPILNEPACSQAPCHAHPPSLSVLGVLDVGMDLAHIDAEVASIRARSIAFALVEVCLIAVIVAVFTRRFVTRPIEDFVVATKEISAQHLDRPIRIDTSRELSELARSFNAMREHLQAAQNENAQFTHRLETMVEERTAQLKAAQKKLLQTDRLASLGQLAASVAHEINNPISGVLNLSMLLQRIVDRADQVPPERLPEFRRYLGQVVSETSRVGRIVADLLAFSRRSRRPETLASIKEIIENTVTLVSHKLELGGVRLALNVGSDVPAIRCDPSQMQQVVMNLLLNAAEATPPGGTVSVAASLEAATGRLVLEVSDTGAGIPPGIVDKIFDPFFTTKEEGKGVGLGLAVVYGIVQSHNGEIEVRSAVGSGTTFRVLLPLGPTASGGAPA